MATISKAQGMRPAEIDAINYINGDLAEYIEQEKKDRADIVKRLDGIGVQIHAHTKEIKIEGSSYTTSGGEELVQMRPGFSLPEGIMSHDIIFLKSVYVTHGPQENPHVTIGDIKNLSVSPDVVSWYQPFSILGNHKFELTIRIQYVILVPIKEEE